MRLQSDVMTNSPSAGATDTVGTGVPKLFVPPGTVIQRDSSLVGKATLTSGLSIPSPPSQLYYPPHARARTRRAACSTWCYELIVS